MCAREFLVIDHGVSAPEVLGELAALTYWLLALPAWAGYGCYSEAADDSASLAGGNVGSEYPTFVMLIDGCFYPLSVRSYCGNIGITVLATSNSDLSFAVKTHCCFGCTY